VVLPDWDREQPRCQSDELILDAGPFLEEAGDREETEISPDLLALL
jgi:hypothetical protein